ncbi:MAG: glycosyltransferase, partial [Candidatus Marinimicrobia bacterium]|nr:glycosyltransferase [Candidatus Neomarinimicrobiota bacterium]
MKSSAVDLSILIPLYNERESIRDLASEITESLGKLSISYEIIFVDDGSRDGSFEEIKTLASTDSRIIGIRFRRNYGKSAALSEGFEI